jgi:hypothetical protein
VIYLELKTRALQVATARAQLQQDRAALEGARAWQSQAEEKTKEA